MLLGGLPTMAQTTAVEEPSIAATIADAVASSAESDKEAELYRNDIMRKMQHDAVTEGKAEWGYWGTDATRYSTWTSHSNRLIPMYTFGITLQQLRDEGSVYRSEDRIKSLYGIVPEKTHIEKASYFDQTDVYRLQQQAVAQGKTQVILIVFDGMDWNTTYNAALYQAGKLPYRQGRGNVLHFQRYRGTETDFGFFVTSAKMGDCKVDVNAQTVLDGTRPATGGYDPRRGSTNPWTEALQKDYLIGLDRTMPHTVTDSASSATSMTSGIKTYNAAINVNTLGEQVEPIGRQLQREKGFSVGVVTSVPISHATPAAAYANNVSRDDYQDLTRDLIGLPSVAHKHQPLTGVDVLIGAGWGKTAKTDAEQGENFIAGTTYYDAADIEKVSTSQGGPYVVVQRTKGRKGVDALRDATESAIQGKHRLLGLFGYKSGHLPFRTADGQFNPTVDVAGQEKYTKADVQENPTLADMAVAALDILASREKPFWLMVEAGDVDWANHANNLDSSIGAVISGDRAVKAVFDWIDEHQQWDQTAVIVTADHGHYFNLKDPDAIVAAAVETRKLKAENAAKRKPESK